MSAPATLVIFPVRNEARNLERLLGPLLEVVQREGYHLLAIDDASTDASAEILRRQDVATIRLAENLGYGAALQAGYKYALANGYEQLMQLDGDGQHDPRFLPLLLQRLQSCDVVIGSRFLPLDPQPFAPAGELYLGTPVRRLGIRLFRLLLRILTRTAITDPTSGYIGMNRRCLRFLSMDSYPYDFPDADVLCTLIRNGFRLCETPVYMYRNESGGQLHRGLAPLWYMFKVTLSLFISGLRKTGEGHPPNPSSP